MNETNVIEIFMGKSIIIYSTNLLIDSVYYLHISERNSMFICDTNIEYPRLDNSPIEKTKWIQRSTFIRR